MKVRPSRSIWSWCRFLIEKGREGGSEFGLDGDTAIQCEKILDATEESAGEGQGNGNGWILAAGFDGAQRLPGDADARGQRLL